MGLAPSSSRKNAATETETKDNIYRKDGQVSALFQETGTMTVEGQSREEASNPTTDILKPKQKCWNVRTLNQTGRLAQTLAEMSQYELTLLGVNESR